jgi:protein O-GlcNAc transferase
MVCWLRILFVLVISQTGTSSSSLDSIIDSAEDFANRGLFAEALDYFERAVQMAPNDPYCLQGAASVLGQLGKFQDAASYFERAGERTKMHQFFMNAGMMYQEGQLWEHAKRAFKHCIDMVPSFRPCHIKAAGVFHFLGDFMGAQHHLQIAIKLDPEDFEAYSYLGDVLNNLKQFRLAIESYQKAARLASGPAAARVLESIADTYGNLKLHNNATQYYDAAALAIGDHIPARLHVGRLFNQMNTANWQHYERRLKDTIRAVTDELLLSGGPSDMSPYQAMFLSQSSALSLGVSRSWAKGFASRRGAACEGQQCADVLRSTDSSAAEARRGVTKVGYISRRFEDYPGTQMMLRLFQVHNRSRISVFCYAHGPDDRSTYRAFMEEVCDHFVDISTMTDSDAFRVIHQDQLDILVDYDGIHDFNNLKVLVEQPARTQVTWLGFAGTTGFRPGEGIDFVLADSFLVPPESARSSFSEKLVYIPGGYQPQDEFQGAGVEAADDRLAAGRIFQLSDVWFQRKAEVRYELIKRYVDRAGSTPDEKSLLDAVWLICFNRIEKVAPEVFQDWMQILQRTENTVLVLMAQTKDVERRLEVRTLIVPYSAFL